MLPFPSFPFPSLPSLSLRNSSILKLVLIIALSGFSLSNIHAQGVNPLSLAPLPEDHQFSEGELQVMTSVLSFYDIAESSNASLSNAPSESEESFSIPAGLAGMPQSVTYTKSFATNEGYDGLRVWAGRNGSDFISVGDIVEDDVEFKTIYWSYAGEEYIFFTLDGTNGIAIRESVKSKAECATVVDDDVTEPNANIEAFDLCRDSDCVATVRVLIVHDFFPCTDAPWFCKLIYSTVAWIRVNQLAINQDVLNNSQVNNLTLEYVFRYIDLPVSLGWQEDLNALMVNPDVEDMRLAVGADLVQLIVFNAGPSWDGVAGSADPGYRRGNDDIAIHSAVLPDFIGAIRYTSIHEIAHNFGALHNTFGNCGPVGGGSICGDFNSPDEPCANAHRLTTSPVTSVGTVLAISNNNNRIPHLSNPDIFWAGVATGTADDNNALVMRTGACAAARIYTSQPSIRFIGIPRCIPAWGVNVTIGSQVNSPSSNGPGSGPYTYRWRWSEGNLGHGTIYNFTPEETSSTLDIPPQLLVYAGITIYLEVTNELGESTEISRFIRIGNCFSGADGKQYVDPSNRSVIFVDMLGRVISDLGNAQHTDVVDKAQELQNNYVPFKCMVITADGISLYPFAYQND